MPVPALVGYQVMQTHAGELILPPNSWRYSHVLTLGGQIHALGSFFVVINICAAASLLLS